MPTPPPVINRVAVDTDPASAFEAFTAFERWWPLAVRSVLRTATTVGFVDGQLVERAPDGKTAVWGTVTRWEPGVAVALTWHPGRPPEKAGQLTVTFASDGAETVVTLEHSGFDGYDDPNGARDDYNLGWPRMLGHFRNQANTRPRGNGLGTDIAGA